MEAAGIAPASREAFTTASPCIAKRETSWTGRPYPFNAYSLDSEDVLVYVLNVHTKEIAMPRAAVDDNNRLALRVRPADKAIIMRAVALEQTDMTTFILRTALQEARSVVEEHERVKLTERDSRLVMELLENPPAPNAKLRKAARALPERS
jgi:uncharacterized protein (DUF1778 family)